MVLIALLGCPKAAPVDAATPVAAVRVLVLEAPDERPPLALPDAIGARVDDVLATHGIVAAPVVAVDFDTRRSTAQRLDGLPNDQTVVLVEAVARFSTELQGRWRWTVDVRATIDPPDGDPVTTAFAVPVFLDRFQDREVEALEAAMPGIERRLTRAVEAWLRGS